MKNPIDYQIDIKPPLEPGNAWRLQQYIDGRFFESLILKSTVDSFIDAGLVKQVKGHKRDAATGEITEFDYESGLDSAGVKYTSVQFELKKKSN